MAKITIEYTDDIYEMRLEGALTIQVTAEDARAHRAQLDIMGSDTIIELDPDDIRRLRHELDVIERLITRL